MVIKIGNSSNQNRMRYALTIILAICLRSLAYGQGTLSGKVFGEGQDELAGATVHLAQVRNDSLVQNALTDDKGAFCFKGVAKGSYQVWASFLGRSSAKKKVMFWGDAHIMADLHISEGTELKEVTVVSHGVNVNGDTTTYIANRFTAGNERTLKDVLGRLPNIHVDEETKTVTAKGKKVSRILLEDNDLFQGNTSIPLDNLSADGIRKVQVIDNYSEYDIYDGFRSTNETVLNVGVDDKAKNRIRGEIEGSGGVMNKYNVRNSSLHIGKKWMTSGIVAANNTGNRLITFQDIMQFSGGMGNLLSGDNPMELLTNKLEAFSAFTNNRRDMERRTNGMVSINSTYVPSQKVKVTMGGIYGLDRYRTHKENQYHYLSGLSYVEDTREHSRQHNGLANIKLTYTPRKDFSLAYTGNVMLAAQKADETSHLAEGDILTASSKPSTWHIKNDLLLAKRLGKHVLSLNMNVYVLRQKETSAFGSDRDYYAPALDLENTHGYSYRNNSTVSTAHLYYLHRLSSAYYLRIALKGEVDKQHLMTSISQEQPTTGYDNDARIDYTTGQGEVAVGKDQGKLNLSLRARYVLLHADTNLKRSFPKDNTHFLSPALQAKYQFTPYHHLMMNYEWKKDKRSIADLMDRRWLKSYHQVESSSVDELFSSAHKVSLSHLLSLQHMGLNFISMASYENVESPTAYNYRQEGYVSIIEKRTGDRENRIMLMSSAEYKLIGIPVNIRSQVQYDHARTPFFYDDAHYRTASHGLRLSLQMASYYKRGFNGKLRWDLSRRSHTGTPSPFRLTTNNLTGQLTWHDKRIYASVDARLATYNSDNTSTRNMYYGFECRYELTKSILLKLQGADLMHLGERKQMTGLTSAYHSVNSLTWYMPGHIMASVTLKY